jgi:DNA modification methylase
VWMLPDADCPGHEWGNEIISQANDSNRGTLEWKTGGNPATKIKGEKSSQDQFCLLCGAWRGSFGLEPVLDCLGWATGQPCGQCYICHSLRIYRELRRLLRKDGTLWLNVGDSYNGGGRTAYDSDVKSAGRGGQYRLDGGGPSGLKPKDLCGVPWRLALALQADGWWLRSDIIWAKPNPMPESCTDRPTTAHEHIFLLTKSANYFWDQNAVREQLLPASIGRSKRKSNPNLQRVASMPFNPGSRDRGEGTEKINLSGRNLRSVWTMPTATFPDAHFATFPPELPRRCIAAGTSEKGCCPHCGAPWKRVVEKGEEKDKSAKGSFFDKGKTAIHQEDRAQKGERFLNQTTGWLPTCGCKITGAEAGATKPCIVLDPFGGAGTTGVVAVEMGRDAALIELSPEYCLMAEKRIRGEMGMMVEVEWLKAGCAALSRPTG